MVQSSNIIKAIKDPRLLSGMFFPAFVLSVAYLVGIKDTYLHGLITIMSCFALFHYKNQNLEWFKQGVLFGTSIVLVVYFLFKIWSLFFVIVEWDFLAFYVYAKAGAMGINIYNPENFSNILLNEKLPFAPGYDFVESILKVGVSYPPTSILFLAPMGFLDLYDANIVWRIFITSFLILDIIVICRHFKTDAPILYGILSTIIIVLTFKGTYTTIYVGQTVFVMLFLILMMYKDPDNWKTGVFLALAITLKPIAAVWGLYFLLKPNWKVILSFSITGLILVMLTITFWGFDNFIGFFISNPTKRIPELVYTDPINQSLSAIVFRTFYSLGIEMQMENKKILVIVISTVLVIMTLIASRRFINRNSINAFLILIPVSLIIYPNCSIYYAPMLLPIIFRYYHLNKSVKYFPLLMTSVFCLYLYSCFLGTLTILFMMLIEAFRNKQLKSPSAISIKQE